MPPVAAAVAVMAAIVVVIHLTFVDLYMGDVPES